MNKTAPFLLRQYAKMAGSKKVRIAMEWSELVRKVNKEGKIQTHVRNKPGAAS